MTASGRWKVRATASAERDIVDISEWTATTFGALQAAKYADALWSTIDSLRQGAQPHHAKRRTHLPVEIRSARVRIGRRFGAHVIFFQVRGDPKEIVVLRILHTSMKISRHLRFDDEE